MPVIVFTLATASGSWRGALMLSTLAWALVLTPAMGGGWTNAVATFTHNQSRIADWFNREVSGGTSVLVHDAGFLSEYTEAKLTDLVGLKSPGAFEVHRALTGPSGGGRRTEAVHLIACRARVDYFVVLNIWDDTLALTEGLRSFGWTAVDAFQSSEDPRHYTVFRLGRSSRCDSE